MAKNTNKRDPTKWVRDRAKAAYQKQPECYICGTSNDLELHHTHSIAILLDTWAASKHYDISTDDGILAVRDEFIAEHTKEIYHDVFTLCNKHHIMLHGIYGKAPPPNSASRQSQWIEIQRAKIMSGETSKVSTPATNFSNFY